MPSWGSSVWSGGVFNPVFRQPPPPQRGLLVVLPGGGPTYSLTLQEALSITDTIRRATGRTLNELLALQDALDAVEVRGAPGGAIPSPIAVPVGFQVVLRGGRYVLVVRDIYAGTVAEEILMLLRSMGREGDA